MQLVKKKNLKINENLKRRSIKISPVDLSRVKKKNLKYFNFVNLKKEENNSINNTNQKRENEKEKEKDTEKEKEKEKEKNLEREKIKKNLSKKNKYSFRFNKDKLIQINPFEKFRKSKIIF